ncbi:MAG: 50S ribosomal protein L30 [bacterium]
MKLKITLKKSPIGYPKDQKATLKVLGLTKLHKTKEFVSSPSLMGMIRKIKHLVEVKEVEE